LIGKCSNTSVGSRREEWHNNSAAHFKLRIRQSRMSAARTL
jgi:hypothetical protein